MGRCKYLIMVMIMQIALNIYQMQVDIDERLKKWK